MLNNKRVYELAITALKQEAEHYAEVYLKRCYSDKEVLLAKMVKCHEEINLLKGKIEEEENLNS